MRNFILGLVLSWLSIIGVGLAAQDITDPKNYVLFRAYLGFSPFDANRPYALDNTQNSVAAKRLLHFGGGVLKSPNQSNDAIVFFETRPLFTVEPEDIEEMCLAFDSYRDIDDEFWTIAPSYYVKFTPNAADRFHAIMDEKVGPYEGSDPVGVHFGDIEFGLHRFQRDDNGSGLTYQDFFLSVEPYYYSSMRYLIEEKYGNLNTCSTHADLYKPIYEELLARPADTVISPQEE